MADYRRAFCPGGTFFFTLVTENRTPLFSSPTACSLLGEVMRLCATSRPFKTEALVLLHDHLHAIWRLPDGDSDFSTRWAFIKANFTRRWLDRGGHEESRTGSRLSRRRRGIWQRRFWEHLIRDQDDFNQHLNYLHYNPVKHGLAACPHSWSNSTFSRWVKDRGYEPDWLCTCDGRMVRRPEFRLNETDLECGE